jgi:hypothetical protein
LAYSSCYSGGSRLSGLLFARRDPALFTARFKCMGLLAPVFLLPVIAGSILLVLDFSWARLTLFIVFALLAFGCARIVVMKLGCPHCKQRQECPAHRKK